MKNQFPFSFQRTEPPKLSDTEWEGSLGKRFDGLVEKNLVTVNKFGKDYPMYSSNKESFRDYPRESQSVEAVKMMSRKQADRLVKDKCSKDGLKNLIYDMKHRELDTIAKMQAQVGLQGVKNSIRGKDASVYLRDRGALPAERNVTSIKMVDFGTKEKNRKFIGKEEMNIM